MAGALVPGVDRRTTKQRANAIRLALRMRTRAATPPMADVAVPLGPIQSG